MGKDEKHLLLWEHLEELRWTLFKLIGALFITTAISFIFINEILSILTLPIETLAADNPNFEIKMIMTSPFDGIMIKMKTAFLGGLIIGIPFTLYFLWTFISAGLKKNESKAFIWICSIGSLLFVFGVVCGYFLITPVLNILLKMGMQSADNYWTLKEFINFVFYWLLGAGLIFELPLAMVILTRLGVLQVQLLKKIRPYFYIGAFVIAAIITPPDPFTMMIVGVPLIVLYELGILIASFHKS
jgi:sec-independent protein translocase protein TatC